MDLNAIPVRSERELYVKDTCIKILKKFGDRPKEQMKRLALFIAAEMEDDYKPKVFHGENKPEILKEYDALPDDKSRMIWNKELPEWRMRDDVSEYNSKKSWVVQDNSSSKSFLKSCVEALEGSEYVLQRKKLGDMVAKYEPAKVPVATIDWNN